MKSPTFTIQYLEASPDLVRLESKQVVRILRSAVWQLPFTHLLIGWQVPLPLLDACRQEADRLGLRFMRWQPLLTGDGAIHPDISWRTVGLSGRKVLGYNGLPEFTFCCPNHPAVQEAIYAHLDTLISQGIYQGFFLDRVRFPSLTPDPLNDLSCFCQHCQRKAAEIGLDLEGIRKEIVQQSQDEDGRKSLIASLLSGKTDLSDSSDKPGISQLLAFRKKTIYDFLAPLSQRLRQAHLEIGLDCFSPCLMNMVGQDFRTLGELTDWIKLMTYAHTDAPAGLPFELSGLARFLCNTTRLGERRTLEMLAQLIGLPLPTTLDSLEKDGLSPLALQMEVHRGVEACPVPVLAGLELVELAGVTRLDPKQIQADLAAIISARPAGLAISWDLLHIPLDRLKLVSTAALGNN